MRFRSFLLLFLSTTSTNITVAFLPTRPNTFRRCKPRLFEEYRLESSEHLSHHHRSTPRPSNVPNQVLDFKHIFSQVTTFPRSKSVLPKPVYVGICSLLFTFLLGRNEDCLDVPSALETLNSVIREVARNAGGDANFQAKIFNYLSHLTLDVVTLVGAPASAVAVRLLAVIGRFFVLAADYVPDHSISPDELSFQIVMLGVAWSSLLKSVQPLTVDLKSKSKNVALRDGRAFFHLFEPSGVTWSQYKALAAFSMEWISLKEGDVIEISTECCPTSSRNIYWLYRGNATIVEEGPEQTVEYAVSRSSPAKGEIGKGLLGDMALLQFLDQAKLSKLRTRSATKSESVPESSSCNAKATAGRGGATLLRIDAAKLLQWIEEYDETLEQPVRNMLLRGIQEKLIPERDN